MVLSLRELTNRTGKAMDNSLRHHKMLAGIQTGTEGMGVWSPPRPRGALSIDHSKAQEDRKEIYFMMLLNAVG